MLEFAHKPIPLIINVPLLVKAQQMDERRFIYFEASKEGSIDREGEMVACAALWASRNLFLEQGDFDLNHWSHLGNPYGTGAKPEYRVGLPSDVKRSDDGKSIFVKGEIFSSETPPPENFNGWHADNFWHGLHLTPPNRWFPSVFGYIQQGGVEIRMKNGKQYRCITKTDWTSVGFAARAQNPDVQAVSVDPIGNFAKAASFGARAEQTQDWSGNTPLVMSYGMFAKAVGEGISSTSYGTDAGNRTGDVTPYQPESLSGHTRKFENESHSRVRAKVLTGKLKPDRASIKAAFKAEGYDDQEAEEYTKNMLTAAAKKTL